MSRLRRAVKAITRESKPLMDCSCGSAPATRGRVECTPCRGCGLVMHSVYDIEAHQNHSKLAGVSVKRESL